MQKMASNNKWRKKYKYGKIKKMNKLYKDLQRKYERQQVELNRYNQGQGSFSNGQYQHEGGDEVKDSRLMDEKLPKVIDAGDMFEQTEENAQLVKNHGDQNSDSEFESDELDL